MPVCENCGADVSPDYVRVFASDDAETVTACPDCPDRTRDAHGRPRKKKGKGGPGR